MHQLAVDLVVQLVAAFFVDQVPLVERQHQRSPGLDDHGQHPLILLGQRHRTVDQHDDHLGGVDRAVSADRGVELVSAGLPDFASQTRSVDESPDLAVQFDQRVHRIHGGAGDVVHHRTLVARQPVQQRTLADVGLADQRHPSWTALAGAQFGDLGQHADDRVEQIGYPATVYRADRMRLPEPQRPQRGRVGFALVAVDFVGGQKHRLARATQDTCGRLVAGGRADDGIHHQDDGIGGTHGHRGLFGHQLLQALGVGLPSPGVLHHESATGPQRVVGDAVTGHPGHVLDHRFAPAQYPVDQRRLADVRPADHRHHGRRAASLLVERFDEFG